MKFCTLLLTIILAVVIVFIACIPARISAQEITTPTFPPPVYTSAPSTPFCQVTADILKICPLSPSQETLWVKGLVFTPLARTPEGDWLQVQIPKTHYIGWIPTASLLMNCGNLDVAVLPVAPTVPDATCSPSSTTTIGVEVSLSAIEPGSKNVTLQVERADPNQTFFINPLRLETTDNHGKRYTFDCNIPGNCAWTQFSANMLPYQIKGVLQQPIDPTVAQVTLSLQIDRGETGIPYILTWQQALTPLASATPAPALVPPEGPIETVYVSQPYLLLGQGANLVILDLTLNPAQPVVIGAAALPAETKMSAIDLLEYYAYVMADGLRIFDISNPTQPVQVGFYQPPPRDWTGYTTMTSPPPPPPRGMDVAVQQVESGRTYAYIAAWAAGLRIVDVADPTAPVEVGRLEFEPAEAVTGIALAGQFAYLATTGGLRVVDVSDPTRPVQITALPAISWDVALAGDRLYLVEGQCSSLDGCNYGSLQAMDISDPANPRQVSFTGLAYSQVVTLAEDASFSPDDYHIYAATRYGLQIFRSTDISQPVGHWPLDSSILIRDMAVSGDYLYLAAGDDGLKILNVADATAPTGEPAVGPEPTQETEDTQ